MSEKIHRNEAGEITAQTSDDGEHEEFLTESELRVAGMIDEISDDGVCETRVEQSPAPRKPAHKQQAGNSARGAKVYHNWAQKWEMEQDKRYDDERGGED
jgi:hypothetical protein